MDTHPYHAGGNAVIDTCDRCRLVWLDAGELTVIGSYQSRSWNGHRSDRRDSPIRPRRNPTQVISLFGFPIRVS